MDLELAGKTAIITGGGTGIGLASARRLLEEGARVLIVGRRADVLDQAKAALAQAGAVEALPCDVTIPGYFERVLQDFAARHGRLDVLVNNAGSGTFAPVDQLTDEDWRKAFSLSADAPFRAIRAAFPIMRVQGAGSIVNIGSIMGVRAQPGNAAVGVPRAALAHLSNVTAFEGAPFGIRSNLIQVGSILSEASQAYADAYPEAAATVVEGNPMKRWGEPDEVATLVCFLASARASFISGACIPADGAVSVAMPFY